MFWDDVIHIIDFILQVCFNYLFCPFWLSTPCVECSNESIEFVFNDLSKCVVKEQVCLSHRIEAKYSSIFVASTIELMMDRVLLLCIVIKYSRIQFVMFSHSKKITI